MDCVASARNQLAGERYIHMGCYLRLWYIVGQSESC